MKRNHFIFINILIAFTLLLSSCSKGDEKKASGSAMPPTVVEAVKVKQQQWKTQIHTIGTLTANQGIEIKPEIPGRVTKILFKSGEYVKEGTPLIQLDPAIYQAQYKLTEAQAELSKSQLERTKNLFKQHVAAASKLDQDVATYKIDEANMEKAKAQLDETLIRAPFSGYIGLKQVDLGDYLSIGQNIVNLQDTNTMLTNFTVPEIYINEVQSGQTVLLQTDAVPGKTFTGEIYALDSRVDPQTRTLAVRAKIPNPKHLLTPGIFANVTILVGKDKNVVTVPQTAIVYSIESDYVYKIVDNKAIKAEVKLGERLGEEVAITQGLQPGDEVVTAGQIKLREGAPVMIAGQQPTKQMNKK